MKTITSVFFKFCLAISVFAFISFSVSAQFVPGEGGALPPAPVFTPLPNTVPGLYVSSVQRKNYAFFEGTYNQVDLEFPTPSELDADSLILQAYNSTESKWENFKHQGEDVITASGDNFSIITEDPETFRLLLVGGAKNGWTSNEVFATVSSVNTYFSGWGLDEGMWISGIMVPYVGRGLEASFSVAKLEDHSAVTNALNYQWYRINPATFEFIKINGATDLKYISSAADAGYTLAIMAAGDNVNAGGFIQVISHSPNIHQVKAFASNVSTNGFTLNLYNFVNDIDTSYFSLVDNEYNPVKINAINKGENNAVYNFMATLDPEKAPYTLMSNFEVSTYWHFAGEMFPGHLMPMLNIEFPSAVKNNQHTELKIYPQPAVKYFTFKSSDIIQSIVVYNIKGEAIREFNPETYEGTVNTEDLNAGAYLLKIKTSGEIVNRRLIVGKQ